MIVQVEYDISNEMFILHEIVIYPYSALIPSEYTNKTKFVLRWRQQVITINKRKYLH